MERRTIVNSVSALKIAAGVVGNTLIFCRIYLPGFVLLLLSLVLDRVDGFLARRFSVASSLGFKLDLLGDALTLVPLFVWGIARGLQVIPSAQCLALAIVAPFLGNLSKKEKSDLLLLGKLLRLVFSALAVVFIWMQVV